MAPDFPTIPAAFLDSLVRHPDRVALQIVRKLDEHEDVTYAEWYQGASKMMGGLAARGITAGDRILIALPTGRDFFDLYLACFLSGVIPLVGLPPRSHGGANSFADKIDVAQKHDFKAIVTPSNLPELPILSVTPQSLRGEETLEVYPAQPEGIAHLQATSGSTGAPRLAIVRHGNLVANVKGIGMRIQATQKDNLVSWLPLSHDMGLVGVSWSIFWQVPLITADPSLFVRNPLNWLRMITQFKGTLSPAPNSAYQACARLMKLRKFKDLDLSSWRVGLCGSEPVYRKTVEDFTRVFEPVGFRSEVLLPVYGLAEATLAVTLPQVGQDPVFDEVDPDKLEKELIAVPVSPDNQRSTNFSMLGTQLEDHKVRIGDGTGASFPERKVGEIEITGPSVISGYWNGEGDEKLFTPDGFLKTGDLGYYADGKLYISGRKKEVIILNGRNFFLHQIEESFRELRTEDRPWMGSVMALGKKDEVVGSERLYVRVEMRRPLEETAQQEQAALFRDHLLIRFDIGGAHILWTEKGGIPRTTSGKLKRG